MSRLGSLEWRKTKKEKKEKVDPQKYKSISKMYTQNNCYKNKKMTSITMDQAL